MLGDLLIEGQNNFADFQPVGLIVSVKSAKLQKTEKVRQNLRHIYCGMPGPSSLGVLLVSHVSAYFHDFIALGLYSC